MNVLLTGYKGFIGTQLTKRLQELKFNVRHRRLLSFAVAVAVLTISLWCILDEKAERSRLQTLFVYTTYKLVYATSITTYFFLLNCRTKWLQLRLDVSRGICSMPRLASPRDGRLLRVPRWAGAHARLPRPRARGATTPFASARPTATAATSA